MPGIPSSQTKIGSRQQVALQAKIKAAQSTVQAQSLSLQAKMRKLRTIKTDDPLQQLQNDILRDLYEGYVQFERFMDPLLLLLPEMPV
jgi:hypothetical protein